MCLLWLGYPVAIRFLTVNNKNNNSRRSYVPPVEDGVVVDLDPRKGIGHIATVLANGSTSLVRFFYSEGISRAVVKNGRIVFEKSDHQHEPRIGLRVRLIVGYLPTMSVPVTFDWCPEASWKRAEEALRSGGVPLSEVSTPVAPHSHGGTRIERSRSGRPAATVVPFERGGEVAVAK